VVYRFGKDGFIQDARYDPKSDFFAHLGGILRIIVEVKSASNEDDRKRMLAQGASLVRLVNKMLIENGGKPDFILMAVYFNIDTTFEQYLLYQIAESNEEDKQKVCNGVMPINLGLINIARYIVSRSDFRTTSEIVYVSLINFTIRLLSRKKKPTSFARWKGH
jgi:hypothetical protein